ncbi:MAG: putative lysozyme, partial [Streblomastix strix]
TQDESGQYKNTDGERFTIIACNEVFAPVVGKVKTEIDANALGYFSFEAEEAALRNWGLQLVEEDNAQEDDEQACRTCVICFADSYAASTKVMSEANTKDIERHKVIVEEVQIIMDKKFYNLCADGIKRDEGFSAKPYKDTVGKLTIAYGRNISDIGISEDEADYMLMNDIYYCFNKLNAVYKWFAGLDTNRQYVLMNMCFNMGITRLDGFRNMIAAIENKDYKKAAREMLNSKWATQVGVRAKRLAEIMGSGKIQVVPARIMGVQFCSLTIVVWEDKKGNQKPPLTTGAQII